MPVKHVTPSRAFIIIMTAAIVSMVQITILPPMLPREVHHRTCEQYDLETVLKGPLMQDDPRLVDWVLEHLKSPSKLPYNLEYFMSGLREEAKWGNTSYSPSQEFILEQIEDMFMQQPSKGKFFIEAGAYDGEFLSNTLTLEKETGWVGLLVEPSPKNYKKLLTKRRKAYSINACLSTEPYASQEMFTQAKDSGTREYYANKMPGQARDDEEVKGATYTAEGSSSMAKYYNKSDSTILIESEYLVQCVPLYSITRALQINHVDLFSLDVEGAEMGILKTIPWGALSFTMLVIERKDNLKELQDFLDSKGYSLARQYYPDYIFVNKDYVKVLPPNPFPDNKRKKHWGRKKL